LQYLPLIKERKRKFRVIEGGKSSLPGKTNEFGKFVIIIFFLITQYTFARSDFFLIREISVVGVKYIPVEKIVEEANILEKNIWKLIFDWSGKKSSENIKKMPWVRDVKVRYELPDRIVINIQERSPKAVVKTGEKYYYIDDEGVVVSPISDFEGMDLPLIRSLDESTIVLGEKLNIKNLDRLLSCLEIYEAEFLEEFPEVSFNEKGDFLLYSNDNIEFRMGGFEGLSEKLTLVSSILNMVREKKLDVKFVDMRYENYVLKLKNPPAKDKKNKDISSNLTVSEEE